jgi:hypothetical protein
MTMYTLAKKKRQTKQQQQQQQQQKQYCVKQKHYNDECLSFFTNL